MISYLLEIRGLVQRNVASERRLMNLRSVAADSRVLVVVKTNSCNSKQICPIVRLTSVSSLSQTGQV